MHPTDLLETDQLNLWQKYRQELSTGQRKQAFSTLQAFITGLKAYPYEKQQAWIRAICQQIFDEGIDEPLTHPLFIELIFPELQQGFAKAELPYARWLAQANQAIYSALKGNAVIATFVADYNYAPTDFYRLALQQDPTDTLAREGLIKSLSSWLNYCIHEVPWGVLGEPAAMQEAVTEFIELVTASGDLPDWENRLTAWQFHIKGWADYLSHKEEYPTYRDYLEANSNGYDWSQR